MSLQTNNLTFKYFPNAKKNIFENLTLHVPHGEITLLTGRSGTGKSTLAYTLAGLYPENGGVLVDGTVFVDGINLATLTPNKRVKLVTMMFQNPDLQFCMNNLEQELDFCLENIGVSEEERPSKVKKAITELDLHHLRNRPFATLSGGEKQKCALACIIALESKYIILDEPLANIDPVSASVIIDKLVDLDVTILAIDHNLALWHGKYHHIISLDGTTPTSFDLRPSLQVAKEPLITARNLIINGIKYPDFTINKGSITAIIGRSGAGKTTLFKTLTKQYKYDGHLTLNDVQVAKIKQKKIFETFGIVFQNPANQFLALTVFDEILFSVKRWHKNMTPQRQAQKVIEILKMFKLEEYQKYSPYMLSQGQQRRLAVLTMIAGAQDILLLDEPTYGQDYENICLLMNLLLEKVKTGLTVIFATHNLAIAETFTHQIIRIGE